MRLLPITYSFFDTDALAHLLEEHYGLREVRCQLIKGTVRATYRVYSAAADYILCIYRHQERTAEEIAAEIALLDYLEQAGIAVATARPQINGQQAIALKAPEGERAAVLFEYIEGEQFSRQPEAATAQQLGRTLAHIHIASDEIGYRLQRPHINFDSIVTKAIQSFVYAAPERVDDIALLNSAAARLQPLFEKLPVDAPAYGLIHGDVIPSNILIRPDGGLTLIDFDFCGYSWRMNDIARFLSEVDYWDMGEAVSQAFLEGYASLRPISAEEVNWIPLLRVAATISSLGTPAYYINTWGSVYFSDKIINKQIQSLKTLTSQMGH